MSNPFGRKIETVEGAIPGSIRLELHNGKPYLCSEGYLYCNGRLVRDSKDNPVVREMKPILMTPENFGDYGCSYEELANVLKENPDELRKFPAPAPRRPLTPPPPRHRTPPLMPPPLSLIARSPSEAAACAVPYSRFEICNGRLYEICETAATLVLGTNEPHIVRTQITLATENLDQVAVALGMTEEELRSFL